MSKTTGKIVAVNGNLLTVAFDGAVSQNEVGYARCGELALMSEVVRVRGSHADMQVFEDTVGLAVGDHVDFSGNLLSVELGPGLLTQIYDGLQNPLPRLAEQCGFFLQRGVYLPALERDVKWAFTPGVAVGDVLTAGDAVGHVPEGIFQHRIMTPFNLLGRYTVAWLAPAGDYTVEEVVAKLKNEAGDEVEVALMQRWPVKVPIKAYAERLRPTEPMVTKVRTVDTFFPVALGGTYCIPGPFGAGKTVLQQITSRNAEVDIVIIAACGERAGEVVETLREFPELTDPKTGNSLMERTIIICNTSSMPVAAREASVYTAVTLAEYYRQMGLNVLLMADSTSRWAQALREMSGRLEEIPGEEAFPAYLESVIASFYERGGVVRLKDGQTGSITIGGTVSPAGGNFDEPVTQATPQGGRCLPRAFPCPFRRTPLPRHRSAGKLDQVHLRRREHHGRSRPGRLEARQRCWPDDEGGGRGGNLDERLLDLLEERVPGQRLSSAGRLRCHRRFDTRRSPAARLRRHRRHLTDGAHIR